MDVGLVLIGIMLLIPLIVARVAFAPPNILVDALFLGFLLFFSKSFFSEDSSFRMIFVIGCVVLTHIWTRQRVKLERAPAEQEEQSAPHSRPEQDAPFVPPVRQTLNTCLRCGCILEGPVCGSCGYDHREEPVHLLNFIHPQELQIRTQ